MSIHARSVRLNVRFSTLYKTFSSSSGEPFSGAIVILIIHSLVWSIERQGFSEPHGNSMDSYRIDVLSPLMFESRVVEISSAPWIVVTMSYVRVFPSNHEKYKDSLSAVNLKL